MNEIIIRSVEVKNFLSVGNKPINISFNRDLNYVVGWNHKTGTSNGVGKTAIFFTSVLYALFGDSSREKIKQDSLINYHNRKGMYVKLLLTVNKDDVEIYRSRKPNNFYYKINSIEYKSNNVQDTQRQLNSYINISEDIFKNIFVINANETIPFIKDSGSVKLREKFEMMFFRDLIFKKILEGVRKKLNDITSDINIVDQSMKENLSFLDNIKKLLTDVRNNNNFDDLVLESEKNISELERNLEFFKNEPDVGKQRTQLSKIKTNINSIIETINGYNNSIFSNDKDVKNLKNKKKILNKSDGNCPICKSKLSESKLKEIDSSYDKIITNKIEESKRISVELNRLTDKKLKLSDFEYKINNSISSTLSRHEIDKNDIINKINSLDYEIKHIREKKDNFDRINTQFKDVSDKIKNIQKERDKLNDSRVDFDIISTIFNNKDGILTFFIRKVVRSLNKIIQRFVKKMQLDFNFEFDDKLALKFNIDNKLSIGNFSSGEQKMINFIIVFSLMEFFLKQMQIKPSFIVIDESNDTSLAKEKLEIVFEVFREFHNENNIGLYFLSHNYAGIHSNILNFKHVIHLEKKDNFTSIHKIDSKK